MTQVVFSASIPAGTVLVVEMAADDTRAEVAQAVDPPIRDGQWLVWRIAQIAPGATESVGFQVRVEGDGAQATFVSHSRVHSDQTPMQAGAPIEHLLERPTTIELAGFSAAISAEGAVLEWTMLLETWTQGYLILRGDAADGSDAAELTPALILSQGGSGGAYRWVDVTAQPGQRRYYWLVVVSVDGSRTSYGPAAVGEALFYLPLVSNR